MQAHLGSSEITIKCALAVCLKNSDGNSSNRMLLEICLYQAKTCSQSTIFSSATDSSNTDKSKLRLLSKTLMYPQKTANQVPSYCVHFHPDYSVFLNYIGIMCFLLLSSLLSDYSCTASKVSPGEKNNFSLGHQYFIDYCRRFPKGTTFYILKEA